MTSTINPTTALPRNEVSHRPSVAKVAFAGGVAALAILGIGITQNGDSPAVQAPTAIASPAAVPQATAATEATPELLSAWAARAARGQAVVSSAAAAAPAINLGPNFGQPATWTEWSVAPAATASGSATPANVR